MSNLLIVEGPEKGSVFDVRDDLRIGRSSSCNITLSDSNASGVHARLTVEPSEDGEEQVNIHDEDSRNGLFVNGKQVDSAVLQQEDEIRIGETVFVFDPSYKVQITRNDETIFLYDSDSERHAVQIRPAGQKTVQDDVLSDHERLKVLFQITRTLNTHMERSELFSSFLEELVTGIRGDRGAILMKNQENDHPRIEATWRREDTDDQMGISQTVIDEVLEKKHAVLCPDASSDPRFDTSKSLEIEQVQSFLAAPLQYEDTVIGMLYVDTLELMRQFEEADLDLLENVAGQATIAIRNIQKFEQTRQEAASLRKEVSEQITMIGDSQPMQNVLARMKKVARTDSTVLIIGETGTGKELMARSIHHHSNRSEGPFTPVDCSTISDQLLESELFGHVEGAFTGADETRPGKFEAADGGTLFLDEISNLNPQTQKKLLRFIEERTFTRVGDVEVRSVDVRILAASNEDLEKKVEEGTFRDDLFYRLNVVPIELPPLRKRKEDIPDLVHHFISQYAARTQQPEPDVEDVVIEKLQERSWKGNVRELRNLVERMVVLDEDGILTESDLPEMPESTSLSDTESKGETIEVPGEGPLESSIRNLEKKRVQQALRRANGKKVEAAERLDVSRPTLDRKIEKYDLSPDAHE